MHSPSLRTLILSAAVAVAVIPSAIAESGTTVYFNPPREDVGWENDLVAFRVYGPTLRDKPEDSGIDCFLKKVDYPIVKKWYEDKTQNYHEDHGEGYDPYHVGSSRGCGGLGIWKDGQIITSDVFYTWKLISSTPEESKFELVYAYDLDGKKVSEVKTITIERGSQLFHVEAEFTQDGKPLSGLEIAIGVTTHDGKAKATFDAKQGWMSCWEEIDNQGLGTGVAIDPAKVIEMKEITGGGTDKGHVIALTKTDKDGKVSYDTGFAWAGAGKITTQDAWQAYLEKSVQK